MSKYLHYLNQLGSIYNCQPYLHDTVHVLLLVIFVLFAIMLIFFGLTGVPSRITIDIVACVTLAGVMYMAIPFSQRVKLLPEPKANKTELVAKAHEEYPYLLTYQVPENNILGKWFGKQTTVKLLIKSDKKVPEMAQKIKHNDDYHYSLETVAVANNRSQTKITDSRKYLRHKINDLQADLTSQRRHVKILNCYRNSQDSLTVKRFGDVN